jgi:hypothetical protein
MGRRKKYKVGDRIFFEYYDGSIGSKIVQDIKPESYVDDNGRTINYDMLITWESGNCSSGTEDYNTLPLSDPRVKALMKQFKEQDKIAKQIRELVIANFGIYDTKTIANALGEVAIEYGYDFDL